MAKVRVIGTYQPERTPLHGLDTRAKIGFLLLMTVAVFAAHSSLSLGICALLLAAALLLARITPMQLAAAMRPAGIVLAFALLTGTLCPAASGDIAIGPIGLSGAGFVRGAVSVVRIALVVGFSLVVASTTTQTQLVDAFTQIFSPLDHHPYTEGLFGAIPNVASKARRLTAIDGLMPDPTNLPTGCKFCTRCQHATDRCREEHPEMIDVGNGHLVRCFRAENTNAGGEQK